MELDIRVPSERRRAILETISRHVGEHGSPPTLRELGATVGLRSPSTVLQHLNMLRHAGYLRRDGRHARLPSLPLASLDIVR